MLFYATFTPGLAGPVARLAEENGLAVRLALDGALLYEAASGGAFLPCFNNVFRVLKRRDVRNAAALKDFIKAAAGGAHGIGGGLRAYVNNGPGTFRVIVSEENALVPMDANVKKRLEGAIAAQTGLSPDRGGAGYEFWFIYRREGYMFFALRLTTHTAYEKTLKRGELHPELAYMLNVLSEPEPDDATLDPFCGGGAIPGARREYFPCAGIYASDIVLTAHEKAGVKYRQADIFDEPYWLPDNSVNKIVTDPPWGLYDTDIDIEALYARFLTVCLRVCAPGGLIVVLTARDSPLGGLLEQPGFERLSPRETHDILVSGKKARIWVIQ